MSVTVAQAMQFGGLAQGRLLAGERNLGNVIDRVSILEAPCSPDWDFYNCLFLTSFYALQENLDGQISTIELLADRNCSALVFQEGILDELPHDVIRRADELGLPLIEIPEAVVYPDVITPLVGAILQEKTYLLQRSEEIHRRLTDLCLSGGGLPAIASALSDLVSRPVALTDAWGSLIACAGFDASGSSILPWLRRTVRKNPLIDSQPAYQPDQGLWLMQLFPGQNRQSDGYIIVPDPTRELDPLGLLAIEQASIIAALEMVKKQAVLETERRLQRNFFEDLLSESYTSVDEVLARAHALRWELNDKHVVARIDLDWISQVHSSRGRDLDSQDSQDLKDHFIDTFVSLVKEHDPQGIVVDQSDHLILLLHCKNDQPVANTRRDLQAIVESISTRLINLGLKSKIVYAFGGFHPTVRELKKSYDEAGMALNVYKKLSLQQPTVWYDDVALYVLLECISSQPETVRWFERTLGKLVEYDRVNGSDLVRTLEVYFDANQILQQAAFHLFVHPKTLKYRLHRIEEILGTDPFSKDQQLNFYLATKLSRMFDFSPRG